MFGCRLCYIFGFGIFLVGVFGIIGGVLCFDICLVVLFAIFSVLVYFWLV
jgi:hypothetical protein